MRSKLVWTIFLLPSFVFGSGIYNPGSGTGGGGGGGSGTINAAPTYQVGVYSGPGSTTTVSGSSIANLYSSSFTVSGTVVVSSNAIAGGTTFYQDGTAQFGGAGDAQIIFPINGNNYNVTSTSAPSSNVVGDMACWSGTTTFKDCGPPGAGGGGSGTVNSGLANQAAYYAAAGTAVSGTPTEIFQSTGITVSTPVVHTGITTIATTPGVWMTWADSSTFNGTVLISSGFQLGGSAGTAGQVATSNGPNSVPSWTTPSAGGGGASTLEVGLASTNTFTQRISSPTQSIAFDQSQFRGQLTGGSTAFVQIAYSSVTVTGSYTTVSTNSFIAANCASACTITLNNGAAYNGKDLTVSQDGAGNVTLSPSAGTISGGSSALMNAISTVLDVRFDGTNWRVK